MSTIMPLWPTGLTAPGPISQIQPFTYQDDVTYLDILYLLRDYIKDIVVPQLNKLSTEVDGAIASVLNEVEKAINAQNALVDSKLAAQDTENDAKIAALTTAVNDAVAHVNQVGADATIAKDAAETAQAASEAAQAAAEAAAAAAAGTSDSGIAGLVGNPDTLTGQQVAAKIEPAGYENAAVFDVQTLSGPAGIKLSVPTHVTPVDGEVTHPSVLATPWGLGGFKYWMGITPYPAGNIDHEDPNIVASQDGITWVVPPGLVNPIDDAPGGASRIYNSDTDLVLGPDGKLWLMWRQVNETLKTETLFLSTSADGITWSARKNVKQITYTTVPSLLSPTLVWDKDSWLMWVVDMVPSPNRLVRWRSTDIHMNGWEEETNCPLTNILPGMEAWHVLIRRVGGQLIGLLTVGTLDTSGANADLQIMTSKDGINFTAGTKPVIPKLAPGKHDRLYRSAFLPVMVQGRLVLRAWYAGVLSVPPTMITRWNLFLTDIEAPGGQILNLPPGVAVPEGTSGNRNVVRTLPAYPAEVARNYVTNPAPATKIDYWGAGYSGPGGISTATREVVGGPSKGSPAWQKKVWTTAATAVSATYHAFGSNTVDTIAVTDDKLWTFSAWLYASYQCVSSVRVIFYNAAGTTLGTEVVGAYYSHAPGTWQRRFITVQPFVGSVRAVIRGYNEQYAPQIADVSGMSSLMANPGSVLLDYNDGVVTPDSDLVPSWTGADYTSQSILTATHGYRGYWDGVKEQKI